MFMCDTLCPEAGVDDDAIVVNGRHWHLTDVDFWRFAQELAFGAEFSLQHAGASDWTIQHPLHAEPVGQLSVEIPPKAACQAAW